MSDTIRPSDRWIVVHPPGIDPSRSMIDDVAEQAQLARLMPALRMRANVAIGGVLPSLCVWWMLRPEALMFWVAIGFGAMGFTFLVRYWRTIRRHKLLTRRVREHYDLLYGVTSTSRLQTPSS